MFDWIRRKTSSESQYNFYIKAQPQMIDTSSTVTATAFTNKNCQSALPCHYKWFRLRNGVLTQAPQFKGSSFICEPSDVGTILQAEIISNDREYSGTAIVQYGPVKLDLMLKKPLQTALALGKCNLNAYIVVNGQQKQCQISINEERIKITPMNIDYAYSFQYSMSEPRLQTASKDPTKIYIIFNQKYESEAKKFIHQVFKNNGMYQLSNLQASNATDQFGSSSVKINPNEIKMQIKFASRSSKDIFLFSTKAFNTKKQMKSSVILSKIQKLDFNINDNFNYILQIQSLRSDLLKMYQINKKINQEKFTYQQEIKKLQQQIEGVVNTYLKIIQEKTNLNYRQLNQSYSQLSSKRDQITTKKYQNLEYQNQHLNLKLRNLTEELDKIRLNQSQSKNNHELYQQITTQKGFKKKIIQNQQHFVNLLDQLNESQIQKKQSDQNKYCRKIEEINREKEDLQKKLQKSFHKIDQLQKKVMESSQVSQPNNQSAVEFNYRNEVDLTDRHNQSAVNTPQYQRIIQENKQIKIKNQSLNAENRKLKNDYSLLSSQNKHFKKTDDQNNFNKSISESIMKKQNELITRQSSKLEQYVRILQKQNRELKEQIENLTKEKSIIQGKYKKRINDMNDEIEILKKNQDALNRSQHISIEMDNYNEQQIQMLKEQNLFLTTENQKLAKACEKYMGDAKQSTKLRQQILHLKQQLSAKLINPEKSVIIDK